MIDEDNKLLKHTKRATTKKAKLGENDACSGRNWCS